MNRRTFLGLLGLAGCKCELDDMNIAKKYWWKGSNSTQSLSVNLNGVTNLVMMGDSNGVGLNASPIGNSFFNLLSASVFSTSVNGAISGAGLLDMIDNMNDGTPNNNLNAWDVNNTLWLTGGIGFNDMRWNDDSAKTQNKFTHAFRMFFLKHYWVFTSSRSVTRTGVHINHNLDTYAFIPNTSDYTNTANCTWEYTRTGTSIGVVLFGNDGTLGTWDSCEIYIDNVLVDTHSPTNQTDNICPAANSPAIPMPYIYQGLTNASHTIKVVSKSTNLCFVGGFFYLNDAITAPTIFQGIQYLSDFGYTQGDANFGSREGTDTLNTIIRNLAVGFRSQGWNVGYFDPNEYYVVETGLDTDGIHYNNTGHAQIASGLESIMI